MRSAAQKERLGHVGAPGRPEAAIWQEVEWGNYRADLAVWERLAPAGSRVLELGCGTGRVSWCLAELERAVWAVDVDHGLVADLRQRASSACLTLKAAQADATALRLGRRFEVILAPLQLVNVIEPVGRVALLRSAAAHLAPGGILAMSLVAPGDVHHALSVAPGMHGGTFDGVEIGTGEPRGWSLEGGLPDVGELEGWVYASQPLSAELDGECLDVCRLREVVSPTGERRESVHRDRFHLVEPELIENEADALGLSVLPRQRVPSTDLDGRTTIVIVQVADDSDQPPGGLR